MSEVYYLLSKPRPLASIWLTWLANVICQLNLSSISHDALLAHRPKHVLCLSCTSVGPFLSFIHLINWHVPKDGVNGSMTLFSQGWHVRWWSIFTVMMTMIFLPCLVKRWCSSYPRYCNWHECNLSLPHIYANYPILKLQIRKKAEVLRAAIKWKMIVKEYYTLDSDSDDNWVGYV